MPLRPQQLDIVLQGLDTDVDPKRQVPGSLSLLENGIYDKRGRISKRSGFRPLGTTGLPAMPGFAPKQLISHDGRLLVWGQGGPFEYSEERNDWGPASILEDSVGAYHPRPMPARVSTVEAIGQISANGNNTDVVPTVDLAKDSANEHLALVAMEGGGTGSNLHTWIYEIVSGRVLHHQVLSTGATVTRPRVASDGTRFVFAIVASGTTLQVKIYDTAAASGTLYAEASTTNLTTTRTMDTAKCVQLVGDSRNGVVWLIYSEDATGDLIVDRISDLGGTPTATNWWDGSGSDVVKAGANEILGFANQSALGLPVLWIAFQGTSGAVSDRCHVLVLDSTTPSTIEASHTFAAETGDPTDEVLEHGGFALTATNEVCLVRTVGQDTSASNNSRVVAADRLVLSGGSITPTRLTTHSTPIRTSQGLAASRHVDQQPALSGSSGVPLMVVTYASLQNQGIEAWTSAVEGDDEFGAVSRNEIVAVVVGDESGGPSPAGRTPRVAALSTQIVSAHSFVVESFNRGATPVKNYGVKLVFTEINTTKSLPRAEAQGNLYLAGGVCRFVDDALIPATPHEPLEIYFLAETTGTVQMRASFELIDARSLVHRGPTSLPRVAAANPEDYSHLDMFWADFGRALSGRIARWRTKANSTVFRLDGYSAIFSAVLASFGVSDAQLDNNPLLTAVRPGLEPVALPSTHAAAVWNGRLWVAPSTRPGAIWPSKLFTFGRGAEFALELEIRVDEGGDVTGLAATPGALLVFQEGQVLAIQGDGPDDNGLGGSFSRPLLVLETIGCTDTASILETPIGVFFRAPQGLRLISGAGLAPGPNGGELGREVDDELDGAEVMSAVILRERTLAVWVLSTNRVLVYDWSRQTWAVWTHTAFSPIAVVEHEGLIALLGSDGAVYRESEGDFFDGASTHYALKLQTGWISTAGIAGFQRVRRLAAAVEMLHDVPMRVTYETDTGGTPRQRNWAAGETSDLDVLSVHVKDQKCSRFRVTVEDVAPAGAPEEGYRIQGLQLEVGLKSGQTRTSGASRR